MRVNQTGTLSSTYIQKADDVSEELSLHVKEVQRKAVRLYHKNKKFESLRADYDEDDIRQEAYLEVVRYPEKSSYLTAYHMLKRLVYHTRYVRPDGPVPLGGNNIEKSEVARHYWTWRYMIEAFRERSVLPDPIDSISDAREIRATALQFLSKRPPDVFHSHKWWRQVKVVRMMFFEDIPQGKVAERLGVSTEVVATVLRRALRRLERVLVKYVDEPEPSNWYSLLQRDKQIEERQKESLRCYVCRREKGEEFCERSR